MSCASLGLFFVLSHIVLLSQGCSSSFQCPGLGKFEFLFSNTTYPHCRFLILNCTTPVRTLQLTEHGPVYNVSSICIANRIVILEAWIPKDACDLLENFDRSDSCTSSPSINFKIVNIQTRNKYPKDHDDDGTAGDINHMDSEKYKNYGMDAHSGKKFSGCSKMQLPESPTKIIMQYQFSRPHLPCPKGGRYLDNHRGKSKLKLHLILGLGIGGGAFIIMAIFVGLLCWKRHKFFSHANLAARNIPYDCTRSELEDGSLCFGVAVFTYNELQEATNNFDAARELGNGAFGTVYHGILKDGREVAVKRLYEKTYKRVEQFKNEVEILTHLRHPNLVSLYGCTSRHSRELLLVYEYVPNGTVADHLYGNRSTTGSLTWPIRMRIAIETASALSYLHHSDVIHRDVKTYNILLDHSFSVKVADFGLSRLFPTDMTHISTAPQGTPGYLDPEYHQCYHLTAKSDVYSFGVVLIELVSSLPAVDVNRHKHEINLSTYAMNRTQCCAFNELVDPQLGFESDFKVKRMTILVAELAFQCLQHENELRPSMDEVLQALERIESADYEALKAQVMEESNDRTKQGESSTENDAVRLIRNVQRQSSPISVMQNWKSSTFTTPNTSS